MKALVSLLALSILATAPALAQKIRVDYDRSVDFDSYKTFAWLPSEESSVMDSDELIHRRIVNEIELRLSESYTRVESDPDIYVTYHTDEREEMRLDTKAIGFEHGPGWGWDPHWGVGSTSSTVPTITYTRGTLIIDLYDAKERRAIWRGTAEGLVPRNPRSAEAKIVNTIGKITTRFANKYREK